MSEGAVLRKALTANDVGSTGSHQAGFHIPKSMAAFFPPLDPRELNPELWLEVATPVTTYMWRYVYYNSALSGRGTRDEYRLTHTPAFLAASGARAGDWLELVPIGGRAYAARILPVEQDDDAIVLRTTGRWTIVEAGRRSGL